MELTEAEETLKISMVLDFGDHIDTLKHTIKDLTGQQKIMKSEVRKIMLKELKLKKLIGEKVIVEVRVKNNFDIDLLEEKYPELYKEYTRVESKIVTITEREFIFDKEKLIKNHQEEYENCFKQGTPGVYITRK